MQIDPSRYDRHYRHEVLWDLVEHLNYVTRVLQLQLTRFSGKSGVRPVRRCMSSWWRVEYHSDGVAQFLQDEDGPVSDAWQHLFRARHLS